MSVDSHEKELICDLSSDSPVMLIAFAGLARNAMAIPFFEFARSMSPFDAKKVFVRDFHRSWYHRGAGEAGANIDEVAEHLRALIADSGVERTVAIGNSSGGYAALLFGTIVPVTEIHAFSPQTFIDRDLRHRHGDDRWEGDLDALHSSGALDSRYADLLTMLGEDGAGTPANIYYSRKRELESVHAERLGALPQVELHVYETEYPPVRMLRAKGHLHELIAGALAGD